MSDLAVEIHKISPVDALNQLLTRRKDTGNCAYDISKHLGKTNKYSKVGWLLPVSLDKVVKEIGWTQGFKGSPDGTSGKEPSCQRRRHKRLRFHPCVGKIPWRRAWQPTPVLLPGKSHGQRSRRVTVQFSLVQLLSHVWLFETLWTATCQASWTVHHQLPELAQTHAHHSSKASVFQRSMFFIVQLSHPYMTTGETIALTRWTFVGKVMSLLFNMLPRLVIAFLPRSKCLLISWLQPPSAVILESPKIKSVTVSNVSPSICHEVIGPDAMIFVFWMMRSQKCWMWLSN